LCENCNNNLTRLEITFTNDSNKFFNSIVEPLTIDERSKLTILKELCNYDEKIDLYSAFSK
jgi:hypothetical protein